MALWRFFDYVNARGDNEIRTWLDSKDVPKKAKAKINARLIALQGFPVFPEGWLSAYSGYPGLYELRISYKGAAFRPFGFYGPKQRQFTLLIGAIEKDSKIPKGLLDSANERMAIVNGDPSRAVPHDFG